MMSNKMSKFENPKRIAELNPIETLKRVGLSENMVLCDIGHSFGLKTTDRFELGDNFYCITFEC